LLQLPVYCRHWFWFHLPFLTASGSWIWSFGLFSIVFCIAFLFSCALFLSCHLFLDPESCPFFLFLDYNLSFATKFFFSWSHKEKVCNPLF
jgi:hypothetical protein